MNRCTALCVFKDKLYKFGKFHSEVKRDEIDGDKYYAVIYSERDRVTGEDNTVMYVGTPDYDFQDESYDIEDDYSGPYDEDFSYNVFHIDDDLDEPCYISFLDPKIEGIFELDKVQVQ